MDETPINEAFAYITDPNGVRYQVLKYDEEGNPVDWDEEATRAVYEAAAE